MDDKKEECPSCALPVSPGEETCPYCGYEFPRQKSGLKYAAWLMILIMLGWLLSYV